MRILLSFLLLSIAQTLLFAPQAGMADDRPNILVIYTDDHSHRSVSCYPEAWEWVKTPNIDRLAARGVRFAHAVLVGSGNPQFTTIRIDLDRRHLLLYELVL